MSLKQPNTDTRKRVLFVHQGAELYGSDRTFEQSIRGYRSENPDSYIVVLLATHGPLENLISANTDKIVVEPIFVLRRQLLRTGALFNLPKIFRALRRAMRVVAEYDTVYINTTVILDYIIACRLKRIPSIIHVHELPSGITKIILRTVLKYSGASLVFNSNATMLAFELPAENKCRVILNGTLIKNHLPIQNSSDLRILLIGRFNSWKGHSLLVNAISELDDASKIKVSVKMVGGVYKEQFHYRDEVIQHVANVNLADKFEFIDFIDDPTEVYHWANLIAVPSLLPEPFGLVAIEAMGHQRPVIAADHGGLAEIVVHGSTGFCFKPGDHKDLAKFIKNYITQPELLAVHGKSGRKRYEELYHEDRYMETVTEVIDQAALELKVR